MKHLIKTLLPIIFLFCSLHALGQDKDFELTDEEEVAIYMRNLSNSSKRESMLFDRENYEEIKGYHSNGELAHLMYKNLKTGEIEGPYEEYYKNGNPKIFGFLIKNKKWNGLHREFYENGQQRIEGQFDDEGRKTGIWEYFEENGHWYKIERYRAGNLKASAGLNPSEAFDGEKNTYYENGQLYTALNFNNGKLEGQQKLYYENGQLKAIETYKNGEITDKRTYYENGNFQLVIPNIKNGNVNGETKEYYKNGKLKTVCYWINGKLDGELKIYKENGELEKIEHYKDDKKID